jgi:nitroreductase
MEMTMTVDNAVANEALERAARMSGLAPSIHNTQPWHWRIQDGRADLFADLTRQLPTNDPDRRMLTISCGGALAHLIDALDAEGYAADIQLLPDAGNNTHLARVRIANAHRVTPEAVRKTQTMRIRQTDRRPLLEQPLPDGAIDQLRSAAARFGIGLDPLDRDQTIDLASATSRAQHDQITDAAAHAELDAWTGRGRPPFAGVPDQNILDHASQTTVPSRDFGHVGMLPVADTHDNAATYAILYGMDDEPSSWLRAGEALSELWLTATELGIAVLPLSAAAEEPMTRSELRRILSGVGYPYLAVRLGLPDTAQSAPAHTPRLKSDIIVEVIA